MRFVLIVWIAVAACGGGSTSQNGTGDHDGGAQDFAKQPDLTPPPPDLTVTFACGSKRCAEGTLCCLTGTGATLATSCDATCQSGATSAACDGPATCGGNPCCVPFTSMNGKPAAGNVTCSAGPNDCIPTVDLISGSGQTRLCHVDADCAATGSALSDCCTGTSNGQSTHFCFKKSYVGLVTGVTCP